MVASVHPSGRPTMPAWGAKVEVKVNMVKVKGQDQGQSQNLLFYWCGVVDDGTWLAKCSKKFHKTQVKYTYKIITRCSK